MFFSAHKVQYLGHQNSEEGIQLLANKVSSIFKAPTPTNLQQLRSFVSLVNYYRKSIPNIATPPPPLDWLLQEDTNWVWSQNCARHSKKQRRKLYQLKSFPLRSGLNN